MSHLPTDPARPRRRHLPAVALAAVLPLAAGAADFGVGIGLGPARGQVDCIDAYPCDRSGTAWKFTGTWFANDMLDLQIAGFGSGRYRGGDRTDLGTEFGGDFKVRGFGLTVGYRWDFAPRWSLSARVGGASVRTSFDYASPFSGSRSKTIAAPLAGIGLGYAVSPSLRVGVDYDETRFKANSERGVLRMVGVAAQFAF